MTGMKFFPVVLKLFPLIDDGTNTRMSAPWEEQ